MESSKPSGGHEYVPFLLLLLLLVLRLLSLLLSCASPPTMPPTIPPTAPTAPAAMSALPQTGISVVELLKHGATKGVVVAVVVKSQQHLWESHCRSGHEISDGFGIEAMPVGQAKEAHVFGTGTGVEVVVEIMYGVVVRVVVAGRQHLRASWEVHRGPLQ